MNPLMEFFLEESAREQRRHEESEAKLAEREAKLAERHKETEAKTDRFLALFERMVEKM